MPIIDPFKTAAQPQDKPAVARPKIIDPFAATPQPAAPPAEEQPGFGGSFKRAFKRNLPETRELLGGATAAVGSLVGSDTLRNFGIEQYKKGQQAAEPLAGPSFQDVREGKAGIGSYAGDVLGNYAGQALQSAAAGAVGAALGGGATAETGPGAVVGATLGGIGGIVARSAVKNAITKRAKKLIDDQVKSGIARPLAEKAAKEATDRTLRQIAGGAAGSFGLNAAQEVGTSYGNMVDDRTAAIQRPDAPPPTAQQVGDQITAGQAARAIGAGTVAGAVDTAAEALGLERVLKGGKSASMLRRVAGGAGAQALTEGGTEATQAALERAGAGQSLTDAAARNDYLENFAAGALGGSVLGGAGGVRRNTEHAEGRDKPGQGKSAPPPAQEPVAVQRPYAAPAFGYTAPTEFGFKAPLFADAAPGSLSDAANALHAAAQPAQPAEAPQTPPGTAVAADGGSARTDIPPPPWLNAETGELRKPTPEETAAYMATFMLQREKAADVTPIAPEELAAAWGLTVKEVNKARRDALQLRDALDRYGTPIGQGEPTQPAPTTPIAGESTTEQNPANAALASPAEPAAALAEPSNATLPAVGTAAEGAVSAPEPVPPTAPGEPVASPVQAAENRGPAPEPAAGDRPSDRARGTEKRADQHMENIISEVEDSAYAVAEKAAKAKYGNDVDIARVFATDDELNAVYEKAIADADAELGGAYTRAKHAREQEISEAVAANKAKQKAAYAAHLRREREAEQRGRRSNPEDVQEYQRINDKVVREAYEMTESQLRDAIRRTQERYDSMPSSASSQTVDPRSFVAMDLDSLNRVYRERFGATGSDAAATPPTVAPTAAPAESATIAPAPAAQPGGASLEAVAAQEGATPAETSTPTETGPTEAANGRGTATPAPGVPEGAAGAVENGGGTGAQGAAAGDAQGAPSPPAGTGAAPDLTGVPVKGADGLVRFKTEAGDTVIVRAADLASGAVVLPQYNKAGAELTNKAPVPRSSLRELQGQEGLLTNETNAPSDSSTPAPSSRAQAFTTAKGSTYQVHADGTTTRNKAARPEHPGEQGPQPRSQTTFYVDDAAAEALGEIQAQDGAKRAIQPLGDGRFGVKYLSGPSKGKFERRTVVSAQTQPAVGLTPVELWKNGTVVHFGNKITAVEHAAERRSNSEQRAATEALPADERDAEIARLRAENEALKRAANTNPVTGMPNKAAFEADEALGWPTVAAIDMDGLKRLNDAIGHEAADKVLKRLADELNALAGDRARFYHRSGDEFAARFADPKEGAALMAEAQASLDEITVHLSGVVDGQPQEYVYQGIGISYGLGDTYEAADAGAIANKAERLASGQREAAREPGAPRRLRPAAEVRQGDAGRGDVRSAETGAEEVAPAEPPTEEAPPVGGVSASGERTNKTARDDATVAKVEKPASDQFAGNKIFTSDKVAAARARLKSKLSTLNSGVDPELLMDGMTIAGAYIESGVRKFGDYAKAMVDDLGAAVKPYLLSFYEAVRHYPGIDKTGMDAADEAARQFDALLTPADVKTDAIGQAKPEPKKRATPKAAAGATKLRDDFGTDAINGYGDSQRETGNDTKDEFIKNTRAWLKAVADELEESGFTATLDRKGKATKTVTVNEGGAAGSGDVMLHMVNATGTGIYVRVGDSTLRGVVPTTTSGISVMYRTTDGTHGKSGSNQWARTDLTAAEMAETLRSHAERNPWKKEHSKGALPVGHAVSPEAAPAPAPETAKTPASQIPSPVKDAAVETPAAQADNEPAATKEAPDDSAVTATPTPVDLALVEGVEPERIWESEPVRGAGSQSGGNRRGNDGRVSQGRRSDRVHGDEQQDLGLGGEPARTADTAAQPVAGDGGRTATDYRPDRGGLTREGSWFETAKRNLDLIDLARKIEAEGRDATPEEQAQLSKYVGFGAGAIRNSLFPVPGQWLKQQRPNDLIFPEAVTEKRWRELAERAAALPREWQQSILQSTQYAHYTSENIIRSIWSAIDRLGFTGGKVLEPGAGIGSFAMLMPESMRRPKGYTGIEFDAPTALIARLLSPQQNLLHDDFIKRKLPRDFFDVAVGNPPFSATKVLGDPDYAKHGFMLHDFFFAKALDRVRPGGLLVFVTSKGTMDKQSDKARAYLAKQADLLGAIRLPSTAFEGNAGTSVVTDVLFLRKRLPGEAPAGHSWNGVATVDTKDGPVVINEYFAANPAMVLGQNRISGHQDDEGRRINSNGLGGEKYTVVSYDKTPEELDAKFAKAVESLPRNAYSALTGTVQQVRAETAKVDFDPKVRREGVVYRATDGTLMRVTDGVGKPLGDAMKLSDKDTKWFTGYLGLRDLVQEARAAQFNDGDWETALKRLNNAYDAFRSEYGPIKDFRVQVRKGTDEDGNVVETPIRIFKNNRLLREDYDSTIVSSLEQINEAGDIVKAPFLLGRTIKKPVEREVKTIGDALAVSLDEIGSLDLDDVAQRLHISRDDAIEALGDQVFEAPGGAWQLADEYLSGDVVTKLEEARAAAHTDDRYKRNVEALTAVQPEKLGPSQIGVKLGASWIPVEHVNAFAREIEAGAVTFDPITESWEVEGGNLRSERRAGAEYGTAERSASELLEAALNSRSVTIKGTTLDAGGKKKEVTDPAATSAANEVIRKIKDKFKSWIWTDADRAAELVEIYNRRYNNIAPRRFDGSHLTLPGVSLRFKLHPHQLRTIWRQIQTGNTYLAHAVGAGKTIEMIAGGMEQKRLGLIRKPIYVVPNHMLEQFANEFMELYPLANIMVADDENFSAERRRAFVAAATLNSPDAIVITHSAFERIGVKQESVAPIRDEIVDQLRGELEDAKGDRVRRSQLEQQIEAVTQRFDRIVGAGAKDGTVKFEDIGVDMIYVDEAHAFRKLDFSTNQKIKGIDPNGSKRALDMYVKTRVLERQRPGRSMVFASGTPVTNTMGELFTILRFFASDMLHKDGIATFDGWSRQFGESVPALEANAAGRYEVVERFAKFDNVPELMSRVRQFMDVLTSEQLGSLVKRPDIEGGKPNLVLVDATDALKVYMKQVLLPRLEASRKWKPSKDEPFNPDPVIAITSDGRFAALDPRFFGGKVTAETPTKLTKMAEAIIAEYQATKENTYTDKDGKNEPVKGGTQIVFYNLGFGEQSQKNRGFNARGALTKALTDGGVKREHIAWFDDADTDAKKEAIFKDMRSGKLRILIGSAKKMGTGVNVQKRLSMLHYFDPPWYPSDVEQPHGRIIRQGNQNPTVRINWYATKGTYDATMWQMVGRKQRFIDQAFTGDKSVRSMDDVSEASQFEQAAAVASGDPRAMQLAGLRQDVERLERLQAAHASEQIRIRSAINENTYWVDALKKRIKTYTAAIEAVGSGYFQFKTGKVGSQSVEKVGDFGEAVKQAFNAAAAKHALNPDGEPINVGMLNGLPVRMFPEEAIKGKPTGKFNLVVMAGDHAIDIVTSPELGADVDAVGLGRRMVNQVNALGNELRTSQAKLADTETELTRLRKKLGAPFEHQQEMLEKHADLKRLEDELKAEGEADAKAAALAAQPPTVINEDGSIPGAFSKQDGAAGGVPISRVNAIVAEHTAKWGDNQPRVKVLASAEDLPDEAKEDPDYKTSEGFYDGKTVYLIAPNLRSESRVAQVLAHEAVGHYGIDRIIDGNVKGGWATTVASIRRLRNDATLGSKAMRDVLAEVERRYPGAGNATFAKETLGVMAERGVKNGLLDRAITAVRAFLRRIMPGLRLSEAELRQLLVKSDSFLRAGGPRAITIGQLDLSDADGQAASYGQISRLQRRDRLAEPAESSGRVAAAAPSGQLDLFTPIQGGEAAAETGKKLFQFAKVVKTGRFRSKGGPIKTWEDAAHIAAPLRKSPQEQMIAVVADSAGNPLAVVRHSIGTIDGATVEAATLIGAIAQIPNASQVWFAHNHPSGKIDQSYADKALTANLHKLMEGSGIKPHGMIVVGTGNNSATYINPTTNDNDSSPIPRGARATKIPMVERSMQRTAKGELRTFGNPSAARVIVTEDGGKTGIYLLNTRYEQVGFLPVTSERMKQLRTGNKNTSQASVLRAVAESNAAAAVLVAGDRDASKNMTQMLKTAGLRVLDSFVANADGRLQSLAQTGELSGTDDERFFSKQDKTETPAFSKPDASIDALDRVISAQETDRSMLQKAKDWLAGRWEDAKPFTLGLLQTRHVLELAEDHPALRGAKIIADQFQQMRAEREALMNGAPDAADRPESMIAKGVAPIATTWRNWAYQRGPAGWLGRMKPEAKLMAEVMHEATRYGLDPSEVYTRLTFEDSRGNAVEWTREGIAQRIKEIRGQMRGRAGDDKSMMMEEVKRLKGIPARERLREQRWPEIVAKWQSLPPEAKAIYKEVRDWYRQFSDETEKALIARIESMDMPDTYRRSLVDRLRLQFEANRREGVYFPLDRNGEYWISFSDAKGEFGFKMFESASDQASAERKLRGAGFTIHSTGKKDQNYRAKDAPSGTFVRSVIDTLRKAGVNEKAQDEVYQVFLKTLPEMSMRKRQIHRRAVPGFSDDALRAFAKNGFHGAHQLARLRHSQGMQFVLEAMQKVLDNYRESDELGLRQNANSPEVVRADNLLAEIKKRVDLILDPKDSAIATHLNGVGFVYYLGLAPASALVNLTQNAQVTLPVLGAHHGWGKAMAVLGKATLDALRTGGNLARTLTSDEERRAYRVLEARGDIYRTQSHTLAGMAEGDSLTANPAWANVMNGISFLFHKAELVNRESTGIAAFRLARSSGKSFEEAIEYASDIINGTHFDYAAANRPRLMQNNTARIALQFKNYSIGMAWMLYRNLYQSFKGATPIERQQARKTLTGILGMTSLLSGATGLPIMGAMAVVANAAHAAFGDDNEPWDFETEFRKWLAEAFGDGAATVVADGVVNQAGLDVASRTSLSGLFFRDQDQQLEGRDAYYNLLDTLAGPIGGIAKNLFVGTQQIGNGHVFRGVETMLPSFAKNALKSYRYAAEGVQTMRGDPIVPDVSAGESIVQALGFRPTRVADQQRINSALKNYEKDIQDRRQLLMNLFALSVHNQDGEARAEAMGKIQRFNAAYPEIAITPSSIRESLKRRARYSADADHGVFLQRKLAERVKDAVGAPAP